jgi:carboxymethylenebutenolidase
MEAVIDVKTPDGVMATHTFRPETGTRFSAVILFQDGVGVRDALIQMARRMASNGYFVALPNLFYRSGPYAPFDPATAWSQPAERERLMAIIKSVTPQGALSDTSAVLDMLKAEATVGAGKVGTVGYCMGGGPALRAAGAFPDRVVAAASYHGGNLATDAPESPHLLASKSRGPLYIGYSENDNGFPEAQRDRLDTALTEANVVHTIELYHAAHGFTMTDFPVYNEQAAERHWETLLAFFGKALA